MRSIALDLETTGLDPSKGHKIIEIGCVELHNNFPSGKSWQKYVNPERKIPLEAYEIHGISEDFLADKPTFSEIVNDFLSFIKGSNLIIHNAAFDLKFLNYELEKINKTNLNHYEIIDTLSVAKKLFPGMPVNLDALSRRYKIDITKRKKHGALLDAEILADVYVEMLGGRQQGMNFSLNEQRKKTNYDFPQNEYCKKIYELKEKEIELHNKLLLKINKNVQEKK